MDASKLAVLSGEQHSTRLHNVLHTLPEAAVGPKQPPYFLPRLRFCCCFFRGHLLETLLVLPEAGLGLDMLFGRLNIGILPLALVLPATVPPPTLDLYDWIGFEEGPACNRQLLDEHLYVYFGLWLSRGKGSQWEGEYGYFAFFEAEVWVALIQADWLIVHEHEGGHLVDEEVAGFGLL